MHSLQVPLQDASNMYNNICFCGEIRKLSILFGLKKKKKKKNKLLITTYMYFLVENADDLVIIAESLEECARRLLTWKEIMEKKGLRGNAGKMKIMI